MGAARKDAMLEMLSVARRIRAIMRDQGRDNGRDQAAGPALARTLIRAGVGPGPKPGSKLGPKPGPKAGPAPQPGAAIRGASRPATRAQQAIRAGRGEDAPGCWYAQGYAPGMSSSSRAASRALCRDNARVVLTAAIHPGHMIVSPDPSDKAHLVMDRADRLLPATEVPNATPRQYPASCCTPGGVPIDSMFDELHERQMRLAGVRGLEYESQAGINERLMVYAARMVGDSADAMRLRDILRPRTRLGKDRGVAEDGRAGRTRRDGRDAHPARAGRNSGMNARASARGSAKTGAELNHANDRAATGRDRAHT